MTTHGKFILVSEFELIVSDYYNYNNNHGCLTNFLDKNRSQFSYYDKRLDSAEQFPNPEHALLAGRRYLASKWAIQNDEYVTRADCLALYKAKELLLTGVMAITLVFEQKKEEFDDHKYLLSLANKQSWSDEGGEFREPAMRSNSYGGFNFSLVCFSPDRFNDECCLLGLRLL